MPLIYDRTETEKEIIICYKRCLILNILSYVSYIGMLVSIVIFRNMWISLLFYLLGFILALSWLKPGKEIKQAMQKGSISVKGSKWSVSNPLTIVITKKKGDVEEV